MRFAVHACTIAVVVAVLAAASPAHACLRLVYLYVRAPQDGAEGVPTNVVPWIMGYADSAEVDVQLLASDGVAVPAELRRVGQDMTWLEHFELHPREELRPNETYRVLIDIDGGMGSDQSFTTGDGPLEGEPAPLPALRMQVADGTRSLCGDSSVACLGMPDGDMVHIAATWEGGHAEMIGRAADGSIRVVMNLLPAEQSFCMDVRPRDMAGRLGEATTVCSNNSPLFDVTMTTDGLGCEDGRVRSDGDYLDRSGGCSVARTRQAPWAHATAAATFLLLAVRRRRSLVTRR